MDLLILGLACVVVIFLLVAYLRVSAKKAASQKKAQNSTKRPVKCPVCQTNLFVGEQLVSKVYRPMKVPDQLMTIYGCPHCYPKCEPGAKRICPVCHKQIAPDQALTARLFNKAVGKKHVHIVGCSNCHKPRAD